MAVNSLTGKSLECLVGVTTAARYKSGGIGDKLDESVRSFRVCVRRARARELEVVTRGAHRYGGVPADLLDDTQDVLGKTGSGGGKFEGDF